MSGHQLVSVPVNSNVYQTVVANIAGGEGGGGQQVQVLGTPIQISTLGGNLQGLVMKTEPGEGGAGAGQGLTITPVSMGAGGSIGGLAGQQFSVLQMAGENGQPQQIIMRQQRSPERRDDTPDTS